MTNYRRLRQPGGTYFFTLVTFNRKPILTSPICREILRNAWINVQLKHPFETVAVCLMPEHIHTIWRLPEGDVNYSMRWNEIKRHFTHEYLRQIDIDDERNESRIKRREQAVWQRRYWEHTFFDEDDLNTHIDYIHYNPVKHGLAERVDDWAWSSYHQYVGMGMYPAGWGENVDAKVMNMQAGE